MSNGAGPIRDFHTRIAPHVRGHELHGLVRDLVLVHRLRHITSHHITSHHATSHNIKPHHITPPHRITHTHTHTHTLPHAVTTLPPRTCTRRSSAGGSASAAVAAAHDGAIASTSRLPSTCGTVGHVTNARSHMSNGAAAGEMHTSMRTVSQVAHAGMHMSNGGIQEMHTCIAPHVPAAPPPARPAPRAAAAAPAVRCRTPVCTRRMGAAHSGQPYAHARARTMSIASRAASDGRGAADRSAARSGAFSAAAACAAHSTRATRPHTRMHMVCARAHLRHARSRGPRRRLRVCEGAPLARDARRLRIRICIGRHTRMHTAMRAVTSVETASRMRAARADSRADSPAHSDTRTCPMRCAHPYA